MRKILLFVILFSLIGLASCEFFNKPDDSTTPDNGVETEKEFNYTVERYFEDLSGNYLIDDSKTEILKAKENENVVAEDKSYEHFVKIEHSDEVRSGKVSLIIL